MIDKSEGAFATTFQNFVLSACVLSARSIYPKKRTNDQQCLSLLVPCLWNQLCARIPLGITVGPKVSKGCKICNESCGPKIDQQHRESLVTQIKHLTKWQISHFQIPLSPEARVNGASASLQFPRRTCCGTLGDTICLGRAEDPKIIGVIG